SRSVMVSIEEIADGGAGFFQHPADAGHGSRSGILDHPAETARGPRTGIPKHPADSRRSPGTAVLDHPADPRCAARTGGSKLVSNAGLGLRGPAAGRAATLIDTAFRVATRPIVAKLEWAQGRQFLPGVVLVFTHGGLQFRRIHVDEAERSQVVVAAGKRPLQTGGRVGRVRQLPARRLAEFLGVAVERWRGVAVAEGGE